MRRKAPGYYVDWSEYEVLRDFEPRRLQMIGAIAVQWNYIDDMVDGCLEVGLNLDMDFAVEVTSRINGMDGKTEILRKATKLKRIFTDAERASMNFALDAVSEYKKYRDAIIHARIANPSDVVAYSAPQRGSAFHIIVDTKALEQLYERLVLLGLEMVGVFRALLNTVGPDWQFEPDGDVDPQRLRASKEFQDAFALIREHQSRRRSLPPLPQLIDAPRTPPTPGAKQVPPG